jgi:preprotein translocase subunit SecG
LLFLFLYSNIGAQDTLSVAKKQKMVFTEKNIVIDTSFVAPKYFSKNLKKKYTDKEFVYEFKTPEKNAWDRFMQWLSNFLKDLFNLSDGKSATKWAEILLRVIAVSIVVFVIYIIVKAIINKEGQWIFGKNSNKKIFDYSEMEKNLHLVDFEKLIEKTLASGENRLSIRYYYLWMLKKMSDKKIIHWDLEKTNSDYLYEIKDANIKDNFAYLSYLYNNIWYGEFELDDSTFAKAKTAFEKSILAINNG